MLGLLAVVRRAGRGAVNHGAPRARRGVHVMPTQPLVVSSILDHAERWHPNQEVITAAAVAGAPSQRHTYKAVSERARRLGAALTDRLGVRRGDRVASISMNNFRHLETYYGVQGVGAVLHTMNPRLFFGQLDFMVGHAQPRYIMVDDHLAPLAYKLADKHRDTVDGVVVMADDDAVDAAVKASEPATTTHAYEQLLQSVAPLERWPSVDENDVAALCYTSGTTGNPKGVAYTHRSTVLHAMSAAAPSAIGLSSLDSVLIVVPAFHACAWSLFYVAPMVGAKVVLPHARLDGPSLYDLCVEEGVTFAAGVPTVWAGLLAEMQSRGAIPTMKTTLVGGSALPPAMYDQFSKLGVTTRHAYGMTETSPLVATAATTAPVAALSDAERRSVLLRQGTAPFGVDMRIVDDDGRELPRDGKSVGSLQVRGHWVVEAYYSGPGQQLKRMTDDEGWFDTGDVATIDEHGFMGITDRSKDIIKSGGEWLSSIDLENSALHHPAVFEAAAIAMPHEKWGERPLLAIVLNDDAKPGDDALKQSIVDVLANDFAKWQLPDKVVFVDELPHTATGKLDKKRLREQLL